MLKSFVLFISSITSLFAVEALGSQAQDLILLAFLVGIFLLSALIFFTLKKLRTCKEDARQKDSSNYQEDQIITNISKNIHDMSTNNEVLSLTSDIIDFLRIKSKKTKLIQETLDFSNLLNDVSGTIKESIKDIPLHLHYNLSSNISQYVYADTLHLSRILENIILYCIKNNTYIIEVNIDTKKLPSKKEKLCFTIETNINIDLEKNEALFNSEYNETTNSYESLDLFIAKELVSLMHGNLFARNNAKGNVEFSFDIPYVEAITSKKEISVKEKKVLIVDSSYTSALCTQNIFRTLGQEVLIISKEQYLIPHKSFLNYDLVIVEDILWQNNTIHNFTNKTHLVSLSNLFGSSQLNSIKHPLHTLQKPLTIKQVKDLLELLYIKPTSDTSINDYKKKNTLKIHRELFTEYMNINLHSFSKFQGYKVLLVEDNIINQKVFQGILGHSNTLITVADNGEKALEFLQEKEFDIVFMDINMPIMDGYTATQHIRKDTLHSNLPIIALSALTSANEIDSMYKSGMNGYLEKPLKKGKLFQAMLTFLDSNEANIIKHKEENIEYLDGLNIKLGILNSTANTIFYREILLEFKDAYNDNDKMFYTLANDLKYDELKLLCLDMRGLSGSIGAEDMNKLVIEILEKLLAKEYHLIIAYAPLYQKELKIIMSSISRYIA